MNSMAKSSLLALRYVRTAGNFRRNRRLSQSDSPFGHCESGVEILNKAIENKSGVFNVISEHIFGGMTILNFEPATERIYGLRVFPK